MAHVPAPPTKPNHARIQFVLTSLAMCALVVTVGWLSDLRGVFHGTIIVLSVAAFLHVLLALAFVLIFLGMSAIAILSCDPDAAPLVRFLRGQRRAGSVLPPLLRPALSILVHPAAPGAAGCRMRVLARNTLRGGSPICPGLAWRGVHPARATSSGRSGV